LAAQGAGSGKHADKQIRRCRALIIGFPPRAIKTKKIAALKKIAFHLALGVMTHQE